MIKVYLRKTSAVILFFVIAFLIVNGVMLSSQAMGRSFQDAAYLDALLLLFGFSFWAVGYYNFSKRLQPLRKLLDKQPGPGESAFSLVQSVIPREDASLSPEIVDYLDEYHRSCIRAYQRNIDELNDYITQWAHEVKIPLSVLELLLEKSESGEDANGKMKVELERTRFLINQILYASRATHYNTDLRVGEFSLEKAVKDAVRRNAVPLIMKNIEVVVRDLDHHVINDEKWLSYILDQILNNASKYTGSDGRIDIWAEEDESAIRLSVQDNGEGICPDEIGRIFEKGFTGEAGRKTAKSTGMGMYYSKKMADRLDIGLEVFSEPRVFTRIQLTFRKAFTW